MKRLAYIAALLTLHGCSGDDGGDLNVSANQINYSIVTSNVSRANIHGASTTIIPSFSVTAMAHPAGSSASYSTFFPNDVITVTSNADGTYVYTNDHGIRYWPETKYALDFFALHDEATSDYTPSYTKTVGTIDASDSSNPFKNTVGAKLTDYRLPTLATQQEDLLYAVTRDKVKSADAVTLNFRHALSQINFQIKNLDGSKLYVEVANITICNVATSGNLYFGTSTATNYSNSSQTYTYSSNCYWNNLGTRTNNMVQYADAEAGVINYAVAPNENYTNGTDRAILMVPQKFTKGSVTSGVWSGVYVKLSCRLYNIIHPSEFTTAASGCTNAECHNLVIKGTKDGVTTDASHAPYASLLYGEDHRDNGTDDDGFKDIYILVPQITSSSTNVGWQAGKKYTYVISFGGTTNSGLKSDGTTLVFVPLTLSVTTDAWESDTANTFYPNV